MEVNVCPAGTGLGVCGSGLTTAEGNGIGDKSGENPKLSSRSRASGVRSEGRGWERRCSRSAESSRSCRRVNADWRGSVVSVLIVRDETGVWGGGEFISLEKPRILWAVVCG